MAKKIKSVELSEKSAAKTKDDLNFKQEAFCQAYVNGDRDLFGNGTQCYLEVYGNTDEETGKPVSYLAAMANASRLLRNDKVIKRINELLKTGGFTNENVDKQHLFLINQHADLKTKLGAIREFNNLKNRTQVPNSNPTFVNISLFQSPEAQLALENFKNIMMKKLYEPKKISEVVEVEQTELNS